MLAVFRKHAVIAVMAAAQLMPSGAFGGSDGRARHDRFVTACSNAVRKHHWVLEDVTVAQVGPVQSRPARVEDQTGFAFRRARVLAEQMERRDPRYADLMQLQRRAFSLRRDPELLLVLLHYRGTRNGGPVMDYTICTVVLERDGDSVDVGYRDVRLDGLTYTDWLIWLKLE